MTERPILFSGAMVRALLSGRKTQTRRVVTHPDAALGYDVAQTTDGGSAFLSAGDMGYGETIRCPYGQDGDRLWVRETWWASPDALADGDRDRGEVAYRADGEMPPYMASERWRLSIHMPRWASRLTLAVTSVRIERLQVITGADVLAEGVGQPWNERGIREAGGTTPRHDVALRERFAAVWDAIHARRPERQWAADPWVWRVCFEAVATARRAAEEETK